jgi:hypothetical protein
MSIPLLVPPMTMEEEAQFGDDAGDQENDSSTGKKGLLLEGLLDVFMLLYIAIFVDAAAVSTKPIRQGQKAQAGLVSGTASATLAGKSHSKKRSRKEILLSEDDSVPGGEKTLTIQMQHTIGRGTSKDDSNILEDVKSLFDEVKTRKDLISQLEELEDPSFKEEILNNKRRIIEVRPIFT